jgi:hypothetical protein
VHKDAIRSGMPLNQKDPVKTLKHTTGVAPSPSRNLFVAAVHVATRTVHLAFVGGEKRRKDGAPTYFQKKKDGAPTHVQYSYMSKPVCTVLNC